MRFDSVRDHPKNSRRGKNKQDCLGNLGENRENDEREKHRRGKYSGEKLRALGPWGGLTAKRSYTSKVSLVRRGRWSEGFLLPSKKVVNRRSSPARERLFFSPRSPLSSSNDRHPCSHIRLSCAHCCCCCCYLFPSLPLSSLPSRLKVFFSVVEEGEKNRCTDLFRRFGRTLVVFDTFTLSLPRTFRVAHFNIFLFSPLPSSFGRGRSFANLSSRSLICFHCNFAQVLQATTLPKTLTAPHPCTRPLPSSLSLPSLPHFFDHPLPSFLLSSSNKPPWQDSLTPQHGVVQNQKHRQQRCPPQTSTNPLHTEILTLNRPRHTQRAPERITIRTPRTHPRLHPSSPMT